MRLRRSEFPDEWSHVSSELYRRSATVLADELGREEALVVGDPPERNRPEPYAVRIVAETFDADHDCRLASGQPFDCGSSDRASFFPIEFDDRLPEAACQRSRSDDACSCATDGFQRVRERFSWTRRVGMPVWIGPARRCLGQGSAVLTTQRFGDDEEEPAEPLLERGELLSEIVALSRGALGEDELEVRGQ